MAGAQLSWGDVGKLLGLQEIADFFSPKVTNPTIPPLSVTSPFTGEGATRTDVIPDASGDAVLVFDSVGGDPNTAGFFEGFLRRSGAFIDQGASGPMPMITQISSTAGDTKLGDVAVQLTPGESTLISRWPTFFSKLAEFMKRWGWLVLLGVFVAVYFRLRKK